MLRTPTSPELAAACTTTQALADDTWKSDHGVKAELWARFFDVTAAPAVIQEYCQLKMLGTGAETGASLKFRSKPFF